MEPGNPKSMGHVAALTTPARAGNFVLHAEEMLGRTSLVNAGGLIEVRRIGWSNGAVQSSINSIIAPGLDAYLSGGYRGC